MGDVELTEKQTTDFKEAFKLFDLDADGFLDYKEVGLVLRSLGLTPTDAAIRKIEAECEENNRTNIDLVEFLAFATKQIQHEPTEEFVRDTLKVFDTDGSGTVKAAELERLITTVAEGLSKEDAQQVLQEAQVDAAGNVNLNQLISVLLSK